MTFTRRKFLKSSAFLMATSMVTTSFYRKKSPLLSFSTLGCPDWSFEKILEFASQHGYHGIEVRGIQRELDLLKCKEFNNPENISTTVRQIKNRNLRFVALGSSANLHFSEGTERRKNLDEAKKFIDLATMLDCPAVRVFPNRLPKDQDKKATMEFISDGLLQLGDHAKGSKVKVLMETHGDLVNSDDIETVMKNAEHSNTGLVWDVSNMWTITKEPPSLVYGKLKKYIHHTHIKDAVIKDGIVQYKLMGMGEVPIFNAIDLLLDGGYKGYYSFEWEKLWHPEIDEPEVALAQYPIVMNKHFN